MRRASVPLLFFSPIKLCVWPIVSITVLAVTLADGKSWAGPFGAAPFVAHDLALPHLALNQNDFCRIEAPVFYLGVLGLGASGEMIEIRASKPAIGRDG